GAPPDAPRWPARTHGRQNAYGLLGRRCAGYLHNSARLHALRAVCESDGLDIRGRCASCMGPRAEGSVSDERGGGPEGLAQRSGPTPAASHLATMEVLHGIAP